MSTYEGTLFDAHDELGLGFADVDYRLHLSVSEDDEVDLEEIEILAVRPQDGTALDRPMTAAEEDSVKSFVDTKTGETWGEIAEAVLASDCGELEFEPDDADVFSSIGWGCDEDYRSCLGDDE